MSVAQHDVVIVGSRCAGAATAMLLARMGHDVALVDRAAFPSDTLSTHAISRGGVVQLHRWGLLDGVLATGTPAVRRVAFLSAERGRIERTVKLSAGVNLLMAPRRQVLDLTLRDAAEAAGATLHLGSVRDLIRDATGRPAGVRLHDGGAVGARTVVAADGRSSRLAKLLGAPFRHQSISPAGTFYRYIDGLDDRGFEFHLAPSAMIGVFPTHADQACVWVSAPATDLQRLLSAGDRKPEVFNALIADWAPSLAERLSSRHGSPLRGAVNLNNHIRQPAGPGWALVGDAGYHRDPITGHGITDAFRDAELLARALDGWLTGATTEAEAARAYDEARTLAMREVFTLTRALAGFPGLDTFIQLQKRLSHALEHEALALSSLPTIPRPNLLAA